MLCSLVSNLAIRIHAKRGTKMTSPADFMPKWDEESKTVKKQSVEEMKNILLSIAGAQNKRGRILKNTPPKKLREKK